MTQGDDGKVVVNYYSPQEVSPEVMQKLEDVLSAFSGLGAKVLQMADQLDTVLARVQGQTTVLDGITQILSTWTDDRAALRQQIVDLQTQLGEAGNDTQQVTDILASFDANDAKLAAIQDKLAPAVVANTPADTGEDTTTDPSTGDVVDPQPANTVESGDPSLPLGDPSDTAG